MGVEQFLPGNKKKNPVIDSMVIPSFTRLINRRERNNISRLPNELQLEQKYTEDQQEEKCSWILNKNTQDLSVQVHESTESLAWNLFELGVFVLKVFLSNCVLLIALPILLVGFALNFALRWILTRYLNLRHNKKVRLMKPIDAFYGVEYHANPCNFTSLYVMQGNCNLDKIRERLFATWINKRDENGDLVYKRMRLKAVKKFFYSCWELHENFDIKEHIRYFNTSTANNPDKPMSEEQVFKEIQKLSDHVMDNSKPQWEALIVPNYVYKDAFITKKHYAIVFRIHHSLMDGISAGLALQHAFADNELIQAVDPLKPLIMPLWKKITVNTLSVLLVSYNFFRAVFCETNNCFHGKELTGPKTLGWSKPVSLDTLKKIKESTKTSTTAVLTCCLGGALRNLAVKNNLPVPPVIYAIATAAVLPYPNIKPQNRFSLFFVPIEIGLETTSQRLQSICKSLQSFTIAAEILATYYAFQFGGRFPEFVFSSFTKILHGTLLLSNVPGPVNKAVVFDGDLLVDAVAWTPVSHKVGISLCLFSYAGKVRASLLADNSVLPGSNDVATVLSEFEKEIETMGKSSGIRAEDCFLTQTRTNKYNQLRNEMG